MKEKFIAFIDKTLSTNVTPLAYLVTVHSLLFGASFIFLGGTTSVQASILFQIGVLFGVTFWGGFVFVACILLLIGMGLKNKSLVSVGSFAMFLLWIFALVAYFASGFWFQGVLAFFTVNYFGYLNLASFMNRLWNYAPAIDSDDSVL